MKRIASTVLGAVLLFVWIDGSAAQPYDEYRETWRNLHPARFITFRFDRPNLDVADAGYVSDRPLEWSNNLGAAGENQLVDPFDYDPNGTGRAKHVLLMVHGYGAGSLFGGGYANIAGEFSTESVQHETGTTAWYHDESGPSLYPYLRGGPAVAGFNPEEWVILGVTMDITQGTGLSILENQRRLRALLDLLWYHKQGQIKTISFVGHSTAGPLVKGVLGNSPAAQHPWINFVDDHINLAGALGGTPIVGADIPGGFGAPGLRHQLMYGIQHPNDFGEAYNYFAGRTAEAVWKRSFRWPAHINVLSVAGIWGDGPFNGNPWAGTKVGAIPWNISNPLDLRLLHIFEGKTDGVVPSLSVIEHIQYKEMHLNPFTPDPFEWRHQIDSANRYGVDFSSNWTLPDLGSPGSLFVTGGAGFIPLGVGSNADNIPAVDRFPGEKVTYVEVNAQHNGMLHNEHLLRAIRKRLGTHSVTPNVQRPQVTGLSQTSGPMEGGNTIRIYGTGFRHVTAVAFGDVYVSEPRPVDTPPAWTVDSETQITVEVPEAIPVLVDFTGPYIVNVSVTNAAGKSPDNGLLDDYQYLLPARTPVITPPGGSFDAPPLVTITTETPGATIYYTLNGSDPRPGNSFAHVYSAPITIPAPLTGDLTPYTLRARAVKAGFEDSGVASAEFSVDARVATPTVFPAGGHFTGFANVTLGTATPGATIYYTLDGSEPTYNSTVYTGQFQLGVGDYEVKARAYRITYNASLVGSATFRVYDPSTVRAADPILFPLGSGDFSDELEVRMQSYTEGSTIRYTIGKNEAPPTPTEASTAYTTPFTLTYDEADVADGGTNWFIRAVNFKAGLPPSNLVQRSYRIAPGLAVTATPTFTPNGGTFNNNTAVTIASATQFARLYYTTDGTQAVYDPDRPSVATPANVNLTKNTTLRAIARRPFFSTSNESSAEFVFVAADPEITGEPTTAVFMAEEEGVADVYVDSVQVEITSATSGSTIRYTLNGAEPDETDPAYSAPIFISQTTTVTAKAFRNGYLHSEPVAKTFVVQGSEGPVITLHPESRMVEVGDSVVFTARAFGLPAPHYQWQHAGQDLDGETADSLMIESVDLRAAGAYRVVVSNVAGSDTSNVAELIIEPSEVAPEIVAHPEDQRVASGGVATFSVVASGKPAPAYQWQLDGIAIRGAEGSELTLNSVQLAQAGGYRVIVRNDSGTDTSRTARLTVTDRVAPRITQHPADLNLAIGDTAAFSVVVEGEPAPSIQWLRDGLLMPGAVLPSFVLPNIQPSDAGSYHVIATNLAGADTSRVAVLTVGGDISTEAFDEIPLVFSLDGNYPNPFNPTTTIRYAVAAEALVRLDVFDLLGRKIATVVDERQSEGRYEVVFRGADLSSGVYLYRLQAGDFTALKRFVVLK